MFGEKKSPKSPEKPRKKCQWCKNRGQCTCQRQYNAALYSTKGPQACQKMCGRVKGKVCGGPMRGGICPCEFC